MITDDRGRTNVQRLVSHTWIPDHASILAGLGRSTGGLEASHTTLHCIRASSIGNKKNSCIHLGIGFGCVWWEGHVATLKLVSLPFISQWLLSSTHTTVSSLIRKIIIPFHWLNTIKDAQRHPSPLPSS